MEEIEERHVSDQDLGSMAERSNSRKGKESVVLEEDEVQLEFVLNVGLVRDYKLSKPYRTRLGVSNDRWNLFLPALEFEGCVLGFLKEGEDARDALPVRVYDRGGHEFEMMLKKWARRGYYVLNRGWASFCDQQRLADEDFVAMRTFRHAMTDMLCFLVTFQRMRTAD